MRPGTPGFFGDRLKAAREARSLTQTALADLLGITRQAVSGYENGSQSPAPQVMRRITEILRVPPHFFILPPPPEETDTIFYRSMESATKSARLKAERRYGWLREIVHYLRGLVQFPTVQFPDFDFPSDPTVVSERQIEEAAIETRRFWNLSDKPISNVAWLVENNGAIMSRHDLGADKLDAFSQWCHAETTPYIVLGSDKRSGPRSRYDVGHELGHMILHRNVERDLLGNKAIFKLIEEQAHYFSGAFLLPESTFAADLNFTPTLDSLVVLKSKWKTSIQFMIMRCESLSIINQHQKTRLFINLSARGWRRKEIYDDHIEPEHPRFLRRSIEMLVKNSIIDPTEIPFRLGLTPSDVEELAGLESGFLGGHSIEPQYHFDSASDDTSEGSDIDPKPHIIRFPKAE
jgi:Zn-dependent peptidase ImmA (M78 family)/DNA-binding XRE family transcriptional regulator